MYLVFDVYDDIKTGRIVDYKELRTLYIKELENDTLDNITEKEIVSCNIKEFVNLAKSDTLPTINDLKDYLESYGWKIIDLVEIQRDLEDLKEYFESGNPCSAFQLVINMINKGVNKND